MDVVEEEEGVIGEEGISRTVTCRAQLEGFPP